MKNNGHCKTIGDGCDKHNRQCPYRFYDGVHYGHAADDCALPVCKGVTNVEELPMQVEKSPTCNSHGTCSVSSKPHFFSCKCDNLNGFTGDADEFDFTVGSFERAFTCERCLRSIKIHVSRLQNIPRKSRLSRQNKRKQRVWYVRNYRRLQPNEHRKIVNVKWISTQLVFVQTFVRPLSNSWIVRNNLPKR